MTKENAKLEQEATELLRRKGYTWSGRPKSAVSPSQVALEKRFIRTPMGGQPKK
jgi:hypothetical protein